MWGSEHMSPASAFADFDALLESVERSIAQSRVDRAAFQEVLSVIESQLQQAQVSVERLHFEAEELTNIALNPLAAPVNSVDVLFRPLEEKLTSYRQVKDNWIRDGFDARLSQELANTILNNVLTPLDQHLTRISQDRQNLVDNDLQDLVQKTTEAVENLTNLTVELVDGYRDELSAAREGIRERIDEYRSSTEELLVELQDSVSEAFLSDAKQQVESVSKDFVEAVTSVENLAGSKINEVQEKLSQITVHLKQIVDLIEPIQPVLDAVASIA
jgi:hypothetical protein